MTENELKVQCALNDLTLAEKNANQRQRDLARTVADHIHAGDLQMAHAAMVGVSGNVWTQNHNQSSMYDYFMTSVFLTLDSLLNDRRVIEQMESAA